MLRLATATYSSRCLKVFHCSSAVSGWWSITTWANGRHSYTIARDGHNRPKQPLPIFFFSSSFWPVGFRLTSEYYALLFLRIRLQMAENPVVVTQYFLESNSPDREDSTLLSAFANRSTGLHRPVVTIRSYFKIVLSNVLRC